MKAPQNNNLQQTPKQKGASTTTVLAAIAILAVVAFFLKPYLGGGAPSPEKGRPPKPTPSVVVQNVQQADLAVSQEFIGKVESIQNVAIRPQIAGEIAQVHFKEGSFVKAGQLLFTLDSREFQATLDLRKADVAKAQANYERAQKYYTRLKAADSRSISAADMDVAQNDVLQGQAAMAQAKASQRLAEIALGHTRIKAPISGRIGAATFTKGNYVAPSGAALATITQMDPIRVSFALPDRDYLDQIAEFKRSGSNVFDATLRLSNGETYPYKGERDFEDNLVDSRTGTITLFLRFKNSDALLVPGAMVRVENKPAESHIAVVIPQEAILSDGAGDFVYLLQDGNTVSRRAITLGEQVGSKQEVVDGLQAGEKLVTSGLQMIADGVSVNPTLLSEAGNEKTPAEKAKESTYDVAPLVSGDSSTDQQEPQEGKN